MRPMSETLLLKCMNYYNSKKVFFIFTNPLFFLGIPIFFKEFLFFLRIFIAFLVKESWILNFLDKHETRCTRFVNH